MPKKYLLKITITITCLAVLLTSCSTTGMSQKSEIHGSVDYVEEQLRGFPDPAGPFEGPQTTSASSLLPADVVAGSNYSIQRRVYNDGFLNTYTIDSPYGQLTAVSTARIYKRIHEMHVIAEIEKISKGKEFVDGVAEKGKDVVKGAWNALTSPIDTVTGAVSGVGKAFKRAGENLGNQARSDQESRLEDISGYAKTKRDYAQQLKIDVYSRNPILQEKLDSLTLSGYTGNLLAALTIGTFTGPIASATGATNLLNKVMKDLAPPDLRRRNREKLSKMGVLETTADAFIKNGSYTPREQTVLVNALFEMRNTQARDVFVQMATKADHYDVTYFRQLQAEMYANHNRSVTPLKQFLKIGQFTVAISDNNIVNLCLPMDYLLWTATMAKAVTILTNQVDSLPWVTKKKIHFIGSLSPMARKNLTKMDWIIVDKIGS